jgi:hypothetical protein
MARNPIMREYQPKIPAERQPKRYRCCGCAERFVCRELIEVGPELVAFGHEVLEGERYCRSCARKRGVL